MADYDLAARIVPVLGTADDVLMDGATATAAVDTAGYKAVVFIANLNEAVLYADVSWSLTESDDNATFTAVAAADVIEYKPASGSSRVFHAGYRGKMRYVKAAFECDGATAAELTYEAEAAAFEPTSITSSTTTATLTETSHGIIVGQYFLVAGATPDEYNGVHRAVTVADANTLTYTIEDAGDVAATGTISVTPLTYWGSDEGADIPATVTVGASAQEGTYHVTVSDITGGSAVAEVSTKIGNTGTGTVTAGAITAAGANAIFGETLRILCTAAAANAGTFTVYREDGSSLGTITVGGGATTIQVGGVNAFVITIADAVDWIVGDRIDYRITDLGVNRYVLTAPDGSVVGYPLGGTAFSTGSHLTFTIPDSTVAVSDAAADLPIVVTKGLARGQITGILGHPLSGPVFQSALET